jgi:hypothetical protein
VTARQSGKAKGARGKGGGAVGGTSTTPTPLLLTLTDDSLGTAHAGQGNMLRHHSISFSSPTDRQPSPSSSSRPPDTSPLHSILLCTYSIPFRSVQSSSSCDCLSVSLPFQGTTHQQAAGILTVEQAVSPSHPAIPPPFLPHRRRVRLAFLFFFSLLGFSLSVCL